jgi:streptomycin 6-kinase
MNRIHDLAAKWGVEIEQLVPGVTSLLGYGICEGETVVLKVVSSASDERHAGELMDLYGPDAVVPLLQHEPGAVLMVRQVPGSQLAEMLDVTRIEAMDDILADVIRRLHCRRRRKPRVPDLMEWGRSFPEYLRHGGVLSERAVERAFEAFRVLVETQGPVTVLHGDLHHYNVLFDENEGWKAIDPKGVVGELEFEVGAALRNPRNYPHLYGREMLETRARRFGVACNLDADRILRWAGVQAVLSVLWTLEDGGELSESDSAYAVARTLGTL